MRLATGRNSSERKPVTGQHDGQQHLGAEASRRGSASTPDCISCPSSPSGGWGRLTEACEGRVQHLSAAVSFKAAWMLDGVSRGECEID
jgi:hypothetical protein